MGGGEINISSDARIKQNIEYVDPVYALNCIRNINPAAFNYKFDNRTEIGFIAQEVEKIIPSAVNLQPEYLTDIYCYGTVNKITDNSCEIVLEKKINKGNFTFPNDIKFTKGGTINNKCGLMDIVNDNTLIIEVNLDDVVDNGRVFVYGTATPDFRTLTKNTIYTYSVAALKQVDIEMQELKKENQLLKERVDFLELFIKEEINQLKQALQTSNN
jgi:hypothetical protein